MTLTVGFIYGRLLGLRQFHCSNEGDGVWKCFIYEQNDPVVLVRQPIKEKESPEFKSAVYIYEQDTTQAYFLDGV